MKTKTNRSSHSPRGFTLLEVLIAVLIVGIIATAAGAAANGNPAPHSLALRARALEMTGSLAETVARNRIGWVSPALIALTAVRPQFTYSPRPGQTGNQPGQN